MDRDPQEELATFRTGLAAADVRTRDLTASEMSDWLEYGRGLPDGFKSEIVLLLIESALVEQDAEALESMLNAIGAGTTYADLSPDLPWRKVATFLERLEGPLLEYGLGILGECGDPEMARYVRPYVRHAIESVSKQASESLTWLARELGPDAPRCACAGCTDAALPDSAFCPFCEDQHYHTHG